MSDELQRFTCHVIIRELDIRHAENCTKVLSTTESTFVKISLNSL